MIALQSALLSGTPELLQGASNRTLRPTQGVHRAHSVTMTPCFRTLLVVLHCDAAASLLNGSTPFLGGTNVVISASGAQHITSDRLPKLPDKVRIVSYGAMATDNFDGIVSVGATVSLDPTNKFFNYGKVIQRSLILFLDMLNYERGGLRVGGKRYGMRFTWVGDGGSSAQVTNSTAHASRLVGADFLFAGYASGYTRNVVKQSFVEGKLLMAGCASSPSVYTQNNLSFGTLPKATVFAVNSLSAVLAAAQALDAANVTNCGLPSGAGACHWRPLIFAGAQP